MHISILSVFLERKLIFRTANIGLFLNLIEKNEWEWGGRKGEKEGGRIWNPRCTSHFSLQPYLFHESKTAEHPFWHFVCCLKYLLLLEVKVVIIQLITVFVFHLQLLRTVHLHIKLTVARSILGIQFPGNLLLAGRIKWNCTEYGIKAARLAISRILLIKWYRFRIKPRNFIAFYLLCLVSVL